MGKGDQRSKRGKIHRGTFGRRRPKSKATQRAAEPSQTATATKAKTKEPKIVKKQPAE